MTSNDPSSAEPARVVLDTNVVLDWLHFTDPACAPLADALRSGSASWRATPAMREELERVLTRAPFSASPCSVAGVLAGWAHWAGVIQAPAVSLPPPGCRCTDADDQKFVDLALHLGAGTWLVSRDRAVLRLARAAARHGVRIVAPAGWGSAAPRGLSG